MMATVSMGRHWLPNGATRLTPNSQLRRSSLWTPRRPRRLHISEENDDAVTETETEREKETKLGILIGDGKEKRRSPDSTDAVASFLTRRFGIGAGLAWLGILTIGTLGEQIKTRLEVRLEQEESKEIQNAKTVTLSSGVSYLDRKLGGGSRPYKGALVVINLKGSIMNAVAKTFEDSFSSGKQIAFVFEGRLLNAPLCPGLEQAMATMQTGGLREVRVPPEAGFGSEGTVLTNTKGETIRIPPNAALQYLLELKRVSIAP